MTATIPTQLISACVTDLSTRLQSIADLDNKVLFVFGQNDLEDKIKGAKFLPAVGVVYEGTRAIPDPGVTAKLGGSAEAVFSLLVINRPDNLFNADIKTSTLNLLDTIRSKILATRGPTGHFWRFVVEAAADEQKGVVFWVQRWSIPIQLLGR
jgi:hypothetical protein